MRRLNRPDGATSARGDEPPVDERLRRRELVAIAAFWALMVTLWVAKRALGPLGPGAAGATAPAAHAPFWATLAHAAGYFGAWALLTPGVFVLARRYPFERGRWVARLALHLAAAVVAAAALRTWDDVVRGLVSPALVSPKMAGGDGAVALWSPLLRLYFFDQLIIYLAILSAGLARDYFLRLQARQAEAGHLRAQLAEARLAALRMQLNPHFLFNTLNTVSALVERDPDGVRRTVARLSDLLRYALESADEQEVPLERELAVLEGYLEIMQVRFGDRLAVRRDVAPAAYGALVPNLVLQPLVENAVVHGVSKVEGPVRVELAAAVAADRLVVSVRDTGPGLAGARAPNRSPNDRRDGASNGVGLANTRARLAQLYGDAATLDVRDADGGGVLAELTLPFRTRSGLYRGAPGEPAASAAR